MNDSLNMKQLIHRYGHNVLSKITLRSIMKQCLEALDYIHFTALVIHRDIKPDNILIAFEGPRFDLPLVKIIDFGLAKIQDDRGVYVGHGGTGSISYRTFKAKRNFLLRNFNFFS